MTTTTAALAVLLTLFPGQACADQEAATADPPSADAAVSEAYQVVIDSPSPEEVKEEIEEAANPAVEEQLRLLREAVAELHGQEVVVRILVEREKALDEAAEEISAERAERAEAQAVAVDIARKEAKAQGDVIRTDKPETADKE